MELDKLMISLAAARVNANLTQDQVAKKMKISKSTLVNWEKGASSPRVEQAEQLSELYNFPFENIIFTRGTLH